MIKKKTSLLAILLFVCSMAFAQKNNFAVSQPATATNQGTPAAKDTTPDEIKVYRSAILFGDYEVARSAVFSLLAKYPTRIDYLDTLARIYFSSGAYSQALLAANIYLDKDPANIQLMELSAVCHGALNNNKESLEMYEKLYAKTNSIFHAYQIGVLQYSLKRYGECEVTVAKLLNDPQSQKEKIQISVDQQHSQEVPLAAAALNLRGVLQKDLNKNDKAKEDFEAALKIAPDFALAKNNLEAMNAPAPAEKEKEKEKDKKK